jgi:hypothetical protein
MKNLLFTILATIFTFSLFAQKSILPPVLVKPTDGATNQMPDAELDWYAVSGIGPVTYEVQIDTSDQFLNPVSLTTDFTAVNSENLIFGDQYFWRVRATDDSGTSEWSTVFDFSIFDQIALNKPDDGDTDQMPDVQLVWSNRKGSIFITGITYYDIEASFFEDFSVLNYFDSVPFGIYPADTNYYFIKTSNLFFDSTYYWRVRARHDLDATEWSEARSFSVLSSVITLTPANNAVNQDPDIILTWEPVTGITDYIYQVCTDPNFTFPCITGLVNDQYTEVEVNELLFGNTYYWRISAAHAADTSDWSPVRNFQVINSVLLHFPENGAAGQSTLPKLEWYAINGIDGYEVRVYDETFTYSDTAFPDTNVYNIFKPMVVGEDYFWKVRTFSNGDTTNWSEVWQFHVGPQGIDKPSLSKDNVSLFPNPSTGKLFIEMNLAKSDDIQVTILDFVGKIILRESFTCQQGIDTKEIRLDECHDGLYFIRLTSGDKSYTEKIVLSR